MWDLRYASDITHDSHLAYSLSSHEEVRWIGWMTGLSSHSLFHSEKSTEWRACCQVQLDYYVYDHFCENAGILGQN